MPERPVELDTKWFVDIIFINGLPCFFASESLCNYLILTTLSFKSKAYLNEGFDKIILCWFATSHCGASLPLRR